MPEILLGHRLPLRQPWFRFNRASLLLSLLRKSPQMSLSTIPVLPLATLVARFLPRIYHTVSLDIMRILFFIS